MKSVSSPSAMLDSMKRISISRHTAGGVASVGPKKSPELKGAESVTVPPTNRVLISATVVNMIGETSEHIQLPDYYHPTGSYGVEIKMNLKNGGAGSYYLRDCSNGREGYALVYLDKSNKIGKVRFDKQLMSVSTHGGSAKVGIDKVLESYDLHNPIRAKRTDKNSPMTQGHRLPLAADLGMKFGMSAYQLNGANEE